ncbi:aspartyl-tRNA(Asn)/glutamyl-tRNA(Gln) amidotransferase subunit A [Rhodococcoides kyotonense]|uniref:Aspartyl-tRNA(Asn)/glutamyl-tRNA(Gln) amidotransferase subunit A n=2 Tax=Rhodococcoides kyotonense TaxID=398843 RepID=A0A239IJA6_9NOCA|nr:aspartyl-tRNA(Asn)/glutamyl-tRNA(Gln) amidotransferase subunit A [Rhodococcus kyotonensis]
MRIGVKDNIDVAGVVSTCGSRFFEGQVASRDSVVVTRLLGAGASVTAKLNMAEFAVGVTSQNTAGPVPRNPWDLSRVPGGSSGGSGSAVAAGLVDASLGTDTGGSVRLPASACGVTGLRPTWGAISNEGVYPVSEDFDTVGPMARTVGEVARLFSVLSRATDLGGVARRIGVPRVFVTDDIDPAIADAVSAAARELESLGYELVPVDVPGAGSAQDIVYTLIYYDLARRHRERLEQSPELFQPATLERISLGSSISENQRLLALAGRDEYRAGLAGLFSDVDVVLTPTMPVDVPFIAGGAGVVEQSRRMGQLTYPWSLHDGPTLALPIGFHPSSGMPIGAQLTAAAGRESVLFDVGARYQQVTQHEQVPPTLAQLTTSDISVQ